MLTEYFEDPAARPSRVLLLYDFTLDEAASLRRAIQRLGQAPYGHEQQIDALPGFVGVEGCSLSPASEKQQALTGSTPQTLGFDV
ncbi:MAG TPA: hypothetical protein VH025_01910 [Solirubrobacteraceae bacterium]|jgi:hypothetical protein|nr:hypothetical protein [Solirubrobacteraceae bacterium]